MEIRNYLENKLNNLPGRAGVLFEDLITGERVAVVSGQDDDIFESASVIKLWIMSCAYEMYEKGCLDLNKEIEIQNTDMVPCPGFADYRNDQLNGVLTEDMFPESGVLNFLHAGLKLTVHDILSLMILISDNTATNIMIDLLGMERINEHIKSLGAGSTLLKRKLFDTDAGALGLENIFSLNDAADYFRMLYEGKLVSEKASSEMLAILQNQQNTYKIPFYIRNLPVAHKTGEDRGIENDVGIVFGYHPFILCFASNETDEPAAVRVCQELAYELEVKNGK